MLGGIPHRVGLGMSKVICALKLAKVMISEEI